MSGDHPTTPLRNQPVDVEAECTRLAQRNTLLVCEVERQTEIIVTLRQELNDAKARNVLLLSKLQEYEAREQ